MKKAAITLAFDEDKLSALEFSLKKEGSSVQARLEQTLGQLYERTVPAPVREYLDSRSAPPPRPRRPPKADAPKGTVVPAVQVKEEDDYGQ